MRKSDLYNSQVKEEQLAALVKEYEIMFSLIDQVKKHSFLCKVSLQGLVDSSQLEVARTVPHPSLQVFIVAGP